MPVVLLELVAQAVEVLVQVVVMLQMEPQT